MLTKRQNFLETIRSGKPDRYVNQYEFMNMIMGTPYMAKYPLASPGQTDHKSAWGITWAWPDGTPGGFPWACPPSPASTRLFPLRSASSVKRCSKAGG